MSLQQELTTTEDRVSLSRQTYNDAATRLTTSIQVFPNVVIARPFGFKEESLFETQGEERKALEVQF